MTRYVAVYHSTYSAPEADVQNILAWPGVQQVSRSDNVLVIEGPPTVRGVVRRMPDWDITEELSEAP